MRRKLLYSFGILFSLFIISFLLSSCDLFNKIESAKKAEPENEGIDEDTDDDIDPIPSYNYYTIIFKDYDGKIIQTSRIKEGTLPKYEGDDLKRKSDNNYSYAFSGWSPTIVNANSDQIYVATYSQTPLPYSRNNNKIYFGSYPQTKVEATVENGLSSIEFDPNTWTSYFYFIESEQPDFMYYLDVDTNNDGLYDYRGVYFTEYRPIYNSAKSTINTSYQDNNGYDPDEIYWFSFDPIEWDIMVDASDKALLISNLILDSQEFYSSEEETLIEHNGGIGYANNYELSNIRKWLNISFYNIAFTDNEKSYVNEIVVDNSGLTHGIDTNEYACNDTRDKMFLLSYSEEYSFRSLLENEGAAKSTDYAKSQGLFVIEDSSTTYNGYSSWWLRTPMYNSPKAVYIKNFSGGVSYVIDYTTRVDYGVRPACWINL